MSDWQPIETAPRDGTIIDLWIVDQGGGHRLADAWWATQRRSILDRQIVSGWFAPNMDYEGEYGFANADVTPFKSKDGREWFSRATHWMPLPKPPVTP